MNSENTHLASTSVDTRPGILFSISAPNSTKSLSQAFVTCSFSDLELHNNQSRSLCTEEKKCGANVTSKKINESNWNS